MAYCLICMPRLYAMGYCAAGWWSVTAVAMDDLEQEEENVVADGDTGAGYVVTTFWGLSRGGGRSGSRPCLSGRWPLRYLRYYHQQVPSQRVQVPGRQLECWVGKLVIKLA